MWEQPDDPFGVPKLDAPQKGKHLEVGFFPTELLIMADDFAECRTDGLSGVETGGGFLAYERQALSTQLCEHLPGRTDEILSVETCVSVNSAPFGKNAENSTRGHRFSSPGFTYYCQRASLGEIKADSIDNRDRSAVPIVYRNLYLPQVHIPR